MFGLELVKFLLEVVVSFAILMCIFWALGTLLSTSLEAWVRRSKKDGHESFWRQCTSGFSERFIDLEFRAFLIVLIVATHALM